MQLQKTDVNDTAKHTGPTFASKRKKIVGVFPSDFRKKSKIKLINSKFRTSNETSERKKAANFWSTFRSTQSHNSIKINK